MAPEWAFLPAPGPPGRGHLRSGTAPYPPSSHRLTPQHPEG